MNRVNESCNENKQWWFYYLRELRCLLKSPGKERNLDESGTRGMPHFSAWGAIEAWSLIPSHTQLAAMKHCEEVGVSHLLSTSAPKIQERDGRMENQWVHWCTRTHGAIWSTADRMLSITTHEPSWASVMNLEVHLAMGRKSALKTLQGSSRTETCLWSPVVTLKPQRRRCSWNSDPHFQMGTYIPSLFVYPS